MKTTYEFIKKCGVFYVLSVNGDYPAGRPITAVMLHNEQLYFSTGATKAVAQQLNSHPQMQIIAFNPNTRKWLRLSGLAENCEDLSVKEAMMLACPNLKGYFPTIDDPDYAVFHVIPTKEEWY